MSQENKQNVCAERLINGLLKENPSFVLMLGMCPTLAVTTSAFNGFGMGLSTTVVLTMSNFLISLLRKVIPDRVRMPAYIVVVASFVTIVDFLLKGFVPSLYKALGVFIPLIVVNCIILGRAESYASKNPVIPSIFDGIGMGLGFTASLTVIGTFRELIGAGQFFGKQILPLADPANGIAGYTPVSIFILAPGAFLVLSFLVAIMTVVRRKMEAKGKPLAAPAGCMSIDGCASCNIKSSCQGAMSNTSIKVAPQKVAPKATEVEVVDLDKKED